MLNIVDVNNKILKHYLRNLILLNRLRNVLLIYPIFRWVLLLSVLSTIPVWQSSFFASGITLDATYTINSGYGSPEPKLGYFFFEHGLYPVYIDEDIPQDISVNEAFDVAIDKGSKFIHVGGKWDNLFIYSYWLDIFLGGDIYNPEHYTAGYIGFSLTLMVLYLSLWLCRLELPGFLAVLILGSNPSQLISLYFENNVFGWPMIIGLIITAIHIPIVFCEAFRHRLRWLFAAAVLSGVLFGIFHHMRAECVTVLPAVIVLYLFLKNLEFVKKLLLISALLLCFLTVQQSLVGYFSQKTDTAEKIVIKAGGLLHLNGQHLINHSPWVPIWMGLGDFDDKYGYVWSDSAAYIYGWTQINNKFFPNKRWKHKYWRYMEALPEFQQTMRAKVISDITNDPIWYATILIKRLQLIIFENTPPRIAFGAHSIDLGLLLTLLIPIGVIGLLCSLYLGEYTIFLLLFFSLCIGGVALGVTTIGNRHYFSLCHLFFFIISFSWLLEFLMSPKFWNKSSATDTYIDK